MHASFEKAVAVIADAYCSWFHMNYECAVYQFKKKPFLKTPVVTWNSKLL